MKKTNLVRQANLPDDAYPHTGGLEYFAKKATYSQCEGSDRFGRCIRHVNENQKEYSIKHFQKVLCYTCQKSHETSQEK